MADAYVGDEAFGVTFKTARAREAVLVRYATLARVLGVEAGRDGPEPSDDALVQLLGSDEHRLWLALSVLGAGMPTDAEMNEAVVVSSIRGPLAALRPVLEDLAGQERPVDVEVIEGATVCDVHTTAQSDHLSGIQRVVRETCSRWRRTRDVAFVAWTADGGSMRSLHSDEAHRMFGAGLDPTESNDSATVVVPWRCTVLAVELFGPAQATRLLAAAQHSSNTLAAVGYDCIPITSAATVAAGMLPVFATWLATVRHAMRVAMISPTAAIEFSGAVGLFADPVDAVPEVAAVPLAVEVPPTTSEHLRDASIGLSMAGVPMVLVVGSHEPRKNHLAVLHAAELLWREGVEFNLVLIGAGTWNADEYAATVAELKAAGRPLQSLTALPDHFLWAAYRLAHCTVFPSLNEGYGLPVAESLAAGTPVITSAFGSMRDIVAPRGTVLGAVVVDPRDDTEIADALRTVLGDDSTYQRLRREAEAHEHRTWDTYADEVWNFLTGGRRP